MVKFIFAVYLIVAILCSGVRYAFYLTERQVCFTDITSKKTQKKTIPKRIFTYWEGDETITTMSALKTWKRNLKDFQIVLLTPSNISKWINCTDLCCSTAETPQLRSDAIRLQLLYKYGGLYMDRTIFALKSYSFNDSVSFEAFFNERNMKDCSSPVIETSFLASVQGHKLIKLWLDGMNEFGCSNENISYWWKKTKHMNAVKWLHSHYHFIYHVHQRLQRKHAIDKFEGVHLKSDTHYKFMPLSVLGPRLVLDQSAYLLGQSDSSDIQFGVFFKITHFERQQTDKMTFNSVSNKSFAFRYFF